MSDEQRTRDVLVAARDLIADEKRWTQGYVARTAQGDQVDVFDPSACAWCAVGAVAKAAGEWFTAAEALLDEVALGELADYDDEDEPPTGVFNDSHSHAEVLAILDRAIAVSHSVGGGGGDE